MSMWISKLKLYDQLKDLLQNKKLSQLKKISLNLFYSSYIVIY